MRTRNISSAALAAAVGLIAAEVNSIDIDPADLIGPNNPADVARALAVVAGVLVTVLTESRLADIGLRSAGQIAARAECAEQAA